MDAELDLEEQLKALQYALARVDFFTAPEGAGDNDFMRLVVMQLLYTRITIDGDRKHARPHIHVDYEKKKHAATYAIDSGERIVGKIATKYDKEVRNFVLHEKVNPKLRLIWSQVQAGKDPKPFISELKGWNT